MIPCKALMVTLSGRNFQPFQLGSDRRVGAMFLYFPPRVVLNQERYFYSPISLMAEIGGYVGLLLGVSFFQLAAWATAFIDGKIRAMRHVKRVRPLFTA